MNVARLRTLGIVLLLAMALLLGVIGLLKRPPAGSPRPPPHAPPTAAPAETSSAEQPPASPTTPAGAAEGVVATVNGQPISEAAWQQAARLDAALNTLAGHPPPGPEETLDRLINETLALSARPPRRSFSKAEAGARLELLLQNWQVAAETLTQTLAGAGLTGADLSARILHLLAVEDSLQQLTVEGENLDDWLAQARSRAEIGLYRPLAPLPAPQAAAPPPEPEPVVAQSPPPAPPDDAPTGPYPGAIAPDFTLNTLGGEAVTLSQLRGKPTLINFWATWCPPCREELPVLQATFAARGDELNFLAVDVREDKGTVQPFAERLGLTFPILLDRKGEVSTLYQVRGIPTTLFVDARGVVVNRHVGPLTQAALDGYLAPLPAPAPQADAAPAQGEAPAPTPPAQGQTDMPLSHDPAPDFTLFTGDGEPVMLSEALAAGPVVLVFYRGRT
ncbi:MAG: redoxin domain-containing protein [Anaerolineae bacterium]